MSAIVDGQFLAFVNRPKGAHGIVRSADLGVGCFAMIQVSEGRQQFTMPMGAIGSTPGDHESSVSFGPAASVSSNRLARRKRLPREYAVAVDGTGGHGDLSRPIHRGSNRSSHATNGGEDDSCERSGQA
jgi:hypothetical protein